MRALITGITGFVGTHLAEHLPASGEAVLGATLHPPPAGFAAPTVTWDVAAPPPDDVARRIAEFAPDVVFHLAALSIPRDCGQTEPTPQAVRVNVDAVGRVLEVARSLPRRPRVVFASSSHVYAAVDPQSPVVAETHPIGPRTAYGKTKWAAEELCRRAVERAELEVVIVRSFTQSGPGQDGRLMLAEWADQFVRGNDAEPVTVQSLDVQIDFLDARDSVRALRLIALHGQSGAVYNLGSGVPRTTGEIFELLQAAAGKRREVRQLRPGRRSDPIADVARLRAATGWTPQIPPAQTVADVLEDRRKFVVRGS